MISNAIGLKLGAAVCNNRSLPAAESMVQYLLFKMLAPGNFGVDPPPATTTDVLKLKFILAVYNNNWQHNT